jgi:hypothetical protein
LKAAKGEAHEQIIPEETGIAETQGHFPVKISAKALGSQS